MPQRHRDGTPYEAFHGSKPDVGHLRVFGFRAWVRVPGELRRKLDARAVAGTFLGYGSGQKGWRVLVDGRVVTSRDVRFDETPIDAGLPADAVQPQHADGADGSVATWPADHDVLDAPGSARVSRTPATSGTQSRAVTLPRPGPIADAVSTARHLVAGNAGGDDSAANVGAEDEAPASGSDQDAALAGGSDSDAPPPLASDSDEEPHAAGEPMSRHPARLLRAKPPRRAHATAAWVSPDGPRVAIGDGTRMPGRVSPPIGPRRGLHASALAASAGGGPDKMHIRRAMKAADWPEFHKANQKEVDALWANKTWVLVDLPPGKKLTETQMLCERKRGPDGKVDRYKGRLVARGDTQTHYGDYFDVWAPVARYATLRALLAHCAADGLVIAQLDVETAFLNEELDEEIYIRQPQGYERGDTAKVCLLKKALYGLKQAARAWIKKLEAVLITAGFRPTDADPCLYVGTVGGDKVFILVYVDDLLVAAKSAKHVDAGKRIILDAFKARDMGAPTYFLGMHIERDGETGALRLSQHQYASNLLERFGLTDANPVRLPMGVGTHLQKDGEALPGPLIQTYQELLGALLYLANGTRPDITFAVGRLSCYAAAPTAEHLAAAKTVLRYIKGTTHLGLKYAAPGELVGYSEADFAADVDSRRSTTGYASIYNGAAISWVSKIQPTVAASTTEAEYVAGAMAAKEAIWLRRLLGALTGTTKAVQMKCDNQGALALMHNAVSSPRTEHIDISHHFIREKVAEKQIIMEHVPTGKMTADALTKPLAVPAFTTGIKAMGIYLTL